MVSLIVLALVFVLIAVRRVGRVRLQIWQVMLLGAIAVLLAGEISLGDAVRAIDLDVMLFLFCMFVVGRAMEDSGYLSHLSYQLFGRIHHTDGLLLAVLCVMGFFSALLMNDTVAIIGTPVVLSLASCSGIRPQPMLLALASAVTVGSVASPIGNPQNLLVSIHGGLANPFVVFGRHLLLPTVLSLLLVYVVLRLLYRGDFGRRSVIHVFAPVSDPALAQLCRLSLVVLVSMLAIKVALVFARMPVDLRLTYIALATILPVLVGSPRRVAVVRSIDWCTLVFFAAMFVLMQSVWQSGALQRGIADSGLDLAAPGVIMPLAIGASQLLSNVPLVALYLPLLQQLGAPAASFLALAAGSTVAGLLTVLGAASNVIIIQNAEQRLGVTLTFLEFARAGVPLTVACTLVYWLFLAA